MVSLSSISFHETYFVFYANFLNLRNVAYSSFVLYLVSPCSTEDALSDWEKKHICSVESILASRAYVKSHSQPLDIKGH